MNRPPDILDDLMFWYDMEEDYTLGHTLKDSSGRGNHIPTTGRFYDELLATDLGARSATVKSGLKGNAIKSNLVYHRDHDGVTGAVTYPDFRLGSSTTYTICGWIYADIRDKNNAVHIVDKFTTGAAREYSIFLDGSSGVVEFLANFGVVNSDDHATPTQLVNFGEWNFICAWIDDTGANTLYLQINNGLIISNTATGDNDFTTSSLHIGGVGADAGTYNSKVDMVMGWKRILSQSERTWLYNNGAGRNYIEANPVVSTEACETTECDSPKTFAFESEEATDSEAGTNVGSDSLDTGTQVGNISAADCSEPTQVFSVPSNGTKAVFPLYVKFYSNFTDAVIRYTLDGEEPTESSVEYTAPVTVDSAGILVKAKAFLSGCPDSNIVQFSWKSYTTSTDTIQFDCDSAVAAVDKAGEVIDDTTADPSPALQPNGTNDFHWFLDMDHAANLAVKRIDLYHLDSNLDWTSGRMWSTDKVITPVLPWDQNKTFSSFPLVVFDGAAQVNTTYSPSFGTVASGGKTYDLYGDPGVSPLTVGISDYYSLVIFLTDGSQITVMRKASGCIATAGIGCPNPELTLVPLCGGEVRADFNILAPARDWILNVFTNTPFTTVNTVTGNGSGAISHTQTGLTAGVQYHFSVQQQLTGASYTHCDVAAGGWYSTGVSIATPLQDGNVVVVSDTTIIQTGGSFNIFSVTSKLSANGSLSVAPAIAGFPVVITKNLVAATTTAVTFPATPDDTDYTFTLTGTDPCGSPVDTTIVRAEDVPDDSDEAALFQTEQTLFSISGYSDSLFPMGACLTNCGNPGTVGLTPWDGKIVRSLPNFADSGGQGNRVNMQGRDIYCRVLLIGGVHWEFYLLCYANLTQITPTTLIYAATKTYGKNPDGVYTRVSGCIATPATITII